ncbi:MAG: sensor histidine kinase [Tetrasphaera sp.]|nr:sensor histidine kinase [Tetrasphaera sp.]
MDLTEALDCLIDNAFAYTSEGVALQVEVLVDDGWVVLTVEDGGPGAPEDAAERGRSGSGSSGLGLSIVRRVVEGAGGTSPSAGPSPRRAACGGPLPRPGRHSLTKS